MSSYPDRKPPRRETSPAIDTEDLALIMQVSTDTLTLLGDLRTAIESDNVPEALRLARLLCGMEVNDGPQSNRSDPRLDAGSSPR
jgi:hypothetical protein